MPDGARRVNGLDSAPCFQGPAMALDDRSKLLKLLAKHAYDYRSEGFKLASGKVSNEYLNCKMALSHAGAMAALGRFALPLVSPKATAVGGLTMGADPIAHSICQTSDGGRDLRWFTVRKEPKPHGLRKLIEGDVPDGANVVVVDDVVTTGGSTVDAIQKARAERLNVVQVLVLVDREEGGLARIRSEVGPDVEVVPMFTKSEVRHEWESQRQTLRATA